MDSPVVDSTPHHYAVLRHSGVGEPHFDLLFETSPGSPLVTFRLSEWPLTRDQTVTRLKDHRRMYLTYEGPVPGDRGRVDRVAEGMAHVAPTPAGWRLRLPDGQPFLSLEPMDAGESDPWWAQRPEH